LKTESFDLPLIMRLGLSYNVWHTENLRLTLAADGINPSDNAQSLNVGAELSFLNELFILRGGFNELFLEDAEKGLTLGAGFRTNITNRVEFNAGYGYQNLNHLSSVNRFTLTLLF